MYIQVVLVRGITNDPHFYIDNINVEVLGLIPEKSIIQIYLNQNQLYDMKIGKAFLELGLANFPVNGQINMPPGFARHMFSVTAPQLRLSLCGVNADIYNAK